MLAGNFGELRENHFHTGIDITTHGVEGLPVHAAADGYVSRIKVGPFGYGKVIYITHPNGYVSVYGHLSEFNDAIGTYVGKEQYKDESFEVELQLQPDEIKVKKGDVIAYSGNTGNSGGPHLHFEIRDEKTEDALNPLLFGLPVKDDVAPVPVTLLVCPAEPGASVNGKNEAVKFALKISGGKYILANATDSIVVHGKIGFAIEGYDKETVSNGKNGVYSIELDEEKKMIYKHHLERLPFDDLRYINAFIDYDEYEEHSHFYQCSFVLPNNILPIYDSVVNNGYVNFNSDSKISFRYLLGDAFANKAIFDFKVKSLARSPVPARMGLTPYVHVLLWDTTNLIDESSFQLSTPSRAFYENEELIFNIALEKKGFASSVSFPENIPVQQSCSFTLYADIPENMRAKSFIVQKTKSGHYSYIGGSWSGNGITADIKSFGTFMIMSDTTAPSIHTSNFDMKTKQEDLSSLSSMKFTIGDNLSGIKSYRATIDGKWVLMQYEPKKKMIWYTFDEHCGKGEHDLVLVVTDKCGNSSTYTKHFTR